ncbi:MAG: hypothetical protein JW959_00800 [Pirellulales bacterium]|nr:hypothetical protein [Pirellulales bacterium]
MILDMKAAFIILALSVPSVADPAADNSIFKELTEKGIEMSDGRSIKLPPPILPDGLDAAGQTSALQKAATAKYPLARLLEDSYYAPAIVNVRTRKSAKDEWPAVRAVDLWFVVHGDWDVLTSEKFLETLAGDEEQGPNGVVSKSGALTAEEMAARNLSVAEQDGYEERFVYATFRLFERVELSATRRAGLARGEESILAAGWIDRRFDEDPQYPNLWRALLRDVRAEIEPGPPHPFLHAGGYAKITRLKKPAGAIFIECHLVYEEDRGWFDGVNLVSRKAPVMVREKVRSLRRKLALASEQATEDADEK